MAALPPARRAGARHRAHRRARAWASRPRRVRWSTAFRAQGKRVGVLAVDPSSPFTGGALLGDRVRMQEHATDRGVFIRSMATRGHLGGLPRPRPRRSGCSTRPASTWSSSRPSASGRPRWTSPRSPTPPSCCWRPAWATAIQAAKAGILEIGDVFVVNKADRDGADADRPRAAATCSPSANRAQPRRLAPADREDDRRRRRGHRRVRRGPGEAPSLAGGQRRAGGAAPVPRRGGDRGASPWRRFAPGSGICAATAGCRRWRSGWWGGSWIPYSAADELVAGVRD